MLFLWPGLSLAQDSMVLHTDTPGTIMDDALADSPAQVLVQPDPTGPELRADATYEGAAKNPNVNNSDIFYFILIMLLLMGVFRSVEPRFFKNLFESFLSTRRSARQVKSKIGQKNMINFLMLIIFYLVSGVYVYYIIHLFAYVPWLYRWPRPVMILLFSLGIMLVYFIKIGFLKLLGFLFEIDEYTDEYTMNISLINKMLTIILLPILCLLIFTSAGIAKIAALISLVIIFLAILNRYARSRESVSSLIKSNKFHFFIYLCASEILPFAVLAKIILK